MVCFIVALCEEALFRGVIQLGLAQVLGSTFGETGAMAVGLAVGALLFGLAHPGTAAYMLIAALFGAWMGVLLVLTGSLMPAIIAHFTYDVILMLYSKYTTAIPREDEGWEASTTTP